MLYRLKHFNLLAALLLMLSAASARAIAYLEVESAYEGDGWFRYALKLPVDYFSSPARVTGFTIQNFGPVQEMVVPSGWTAPNDTQAVWLPEGTVTRPSQHVFRCRSSYRDFKTGSSANSVQLTTLSGDSGLGFDLNGYAWCDGLIPCPPEEADGSATVLTTKVENNPDLRITNLSLYQARVTGISVNWSIALVYVLEASPDLAVWHDVTTFSTTPDGSAQLGSLEDPGPFFRVRVYDSGSSGLSSTEAAANASADQRFLHVTKFEVKKNTTTVTFGSQAGTLYTVELLSLSGQSLKKTEVTGTADTTNVNMTVSSPLGAVWVRVSTPSTVTR